MTPYTFLIRLTIVVLFFIAIDFYTFSGVKTLLSDIQDERTKKAIYYTYWGITVAWCLLLGINIVQFDVKTGPPRNVLFQWLGATMMLIWLPKLFFASILMLEDLFRWTYASTLWVLDITGWQKREVQTDWLLSRRKIISQIAFGVASIPFAGIFHGIIWGKYNFKVWEYELHFEDLPNAFDGLKIAQISDIHAGSLDNQKEIQRGIDLLNAQKADIVVFTGDLVNNMASEFDKWVTLFSKIEAPLGKYSIVGNHDYGDYIVWESKEAKEKNFQDLVAQHGKIGFRCLLNEHVSFNRGQDEIALVGVENWGLPPFPQKGDLNTAMLGLEPGTFTILLSHDPSHWDAEVLHWPQPIHLTLSGHTHGMQFGIEIPGILRWSPVKYKYPRWAGMYRMGKKFLNVNRGFGYIGFHGRVGIWPEISLITLKRKLV